MWPVFMLLVKVILYAGVAGVIGCIFNLWLFRQSDTFPGWLERYGLVSAVLVLVAASLGFLLQVGYTAGSGFAGMFDANLLGFLWSTPVGDQLQWRLLGAASIILALLVGIRGRGFVRLITRSLLGAGAIALVFSFQVSGHSAQGSLVERVALLVHVAGIALWIGSLPPLYRHCSAGCENMATPLRLFGRVAVYFLAALAAAGIWLLLFLPSSPAAIFDTTWGGMIAFKLALVGLLIALAAQNKFVLVPAVAQRESANALRLSIAFEMVLAVAVLLVTAAATTLSGPMVA